MVEVTCFNLEIAMSRMLRLPSAPYVTELDKTGSQEHIMDDLEMTTFEGTDSIHPSSKASTDGGAIEGHTIAVGAST
jgi:hypothetical protein